MSCTLISLRDSRVGMGVGVGVEVGLGEGVGVFVGAGSCCVPDSVIEEASFDDKSDIPLISASSSIPSFRPVLPGPWIACPWFPIPRFPCPWFSCPSLPVVRKSKSLPAMRPMPRPITARARTSNIVSRILFRFFLFFTVPPMMAQISLSLRQPLSPDYINMHY